ncbi:hypothetical protein NQZ79_g8534 [Umbelopsis isabellina]|nr:hypothetical protein NQZ79_g8534 [Umbelopsis isabellina]
MAKTASAKAPKATKATKVSKNTKAVKKAEPVKQKIEDESASSSSSSSESDSDSSESESEDEKKSKKSKKATKKVSKKVSKKAAKKEESSDSSSSESESEKEEAKADSSDSDSSSDEEEEKVVAKKEESSSDSSESEEEAKKEESDSSDSDSSSDEKEKAKSDSSDSDSSDSDSSDEEEKDTEMAEAATNGKRKADTDAESPAKVAKVETDEVHTVWVGGLDFNATGEDVRQFFAECGTVIDARIVNDRNTGRSKGYGYVDFADAESKAEAKKYHETEFMGRQIRVDDAPTRGAQPRDNGAQRSKPLSNKSDTVFVGNISFECDDHSLREAFEGFVLRDTVMSNSTLKMLLRKLSMR